MDRTLMPGEVWVGNNEWCMQPALLGIDRRTSWPWMQAERGNKTTKNSFIHDQAHNAHRTSRPLYTQLLRRQRVLPLRQRDPSLRIAHILLRHRQPLIRQTVRQHKDIDPCSRPVTLRIGSSIADAIIRDVVLNIAPGRPMAGH